MAEKSSLQDYDLTLSAKKSSEDINAREGFLIISAAKSGKACLRRKTVITLWLAL